MPPKAKPAPAKEQTPIQVLKKIFEIVARFDFIPEGYHYFNGWKLYISGGYISVELTQEGGNDIEIAKSESGKVYFTRFPIVIMHTFVPQEFVDAFEKEIEKFVSDESSELISKLDEKREGHKKAIVSIDKQKEKYQSKQ